MFHENLIFNGFNEIETNNNFSLFETGRKGRGFVSLEEKWKANFRSLIEQIKIDELERKVWVRVTFEEELKAIILLFNVIYLNQVGQRNAIDMLFVPNRVTK
jgi:hypothetical protein